MIQTKKFEMRLLVAVAVLCLAAMLGLSGKASATLAGEDGLILYVENENYDTIKMCEAPVYGILEEHFVEMDDEYECELPVNEVVTTDPDGTSETVAATEEDPITAATISAPNEDGNNEIVYAVSESYCLDKVDWLDMDSDYVMPELEREPCEGGWMYESFNNNVVLNHVEVDADGNPIADPTTVLDLDPTSPDAPGNQSVTGLSYSPDGDSVVMTRVEMSYEEPDRRVNTLIEDADRRRGPQPTWTVEKVTVDDGTVETLVDPRFDPFVAAGYGQDGNVYFTQSSRLEELDMPMVNDRMGENDRNSDLWYIPAGGDKDDAVQVTNSSVINEYFLSVSPDSTKVLVCDPMTSLYYYINLADGSALELSLADGFTPVGFSPSGEALYGNSNTRNPLATRTESDCGDRLVRRSIASLKEATMDEVARGVAVALQTELENPVVINEDLRGVEDWAPKYVAVVEEVPEEETEDKVLGESVTITEQVLESTGSGALFGLAVGLMTVTTASGVTAAKRKD